MLTKPSTTGTKNKPAQSVSEYVQSRINSASQNGYGSTKMWVKNPNLGEVKELLASAGFQYAEIQKDEKSVQLEVSW